MGKFIDLTNMQFNRLKVIKYVGKSKWECICDCGNIKNIASKHLIKSNTKSCGCLNIENITLIGKNKKHGMYKTRFYRIWRNIKTRCLNCNSSHYKDYGGRGITICDNWLDFNNFYNDMYKNYIKHVEIYGEKNTSIDRINNDGNYELKNCKWSTQKEQTSNTRLNKLFKAISPVGEIFYSNNQTQFSKDHNLCVSEINNCLKNKVKHHKGWKFNYIEEERIIIKI